MDQSSKAPTTASSASNKLMVLIHLMIMLCLVALVVILALLLVALKDMKGELYAQLEYLTTAVHIGAFRIELQSGTSRYDPIFFEVVT
jgi:heme A synthase